MTLWSGLIQGLIYPGLLSALLAGGLCRGIAAWLGAHWDRRPAAPVWQPLSEIWHLAGKSWPHQLDTPLALASWFGLLGLAALSWATGMLPLPWALVPAPAPLPGGYILYVTFLLVPPLARLVAAGLSAHPLAALGARRQAPLEVARLLPLMLAAAALPLSTGQHTLPQQAPSGLLHAGVCVAVSGIVLLTLPWSLWDRDEHDALLAALGGRSLALFRALAALELTAQTGLAAVALQASGLFPSEREWLAPLAAYVAAIVVLTMLEWRRQRLPLVDAARRYTRWLLPVAVVLVGLGWWAGG